MTNSKTTHTPGPWQCQPTAGNHDFLIYNESNGKDIALVRDFNEPNARLIAAAPELLQWLEAAESMLTQAMKQTEFTLGACKNMTEIRAAIAKARGE